MRCIADAALSVEHRIQRGSIAWTSGDTRACGKNSNSGQSCVNMI